MVPTAEIQQAQAAVDAAPQAERAQRTVALNTLIAAQSRVAVRDLASGRETEFDTGRMRKTGLAFVAGGGAAASGVLLAAAPAEADPHRYMHSRTALPRRLSPPVTPTRPLVTRTRLDLR